MTDENTPNSFDSAIPTPFRFGDPRQKIIYDRLMRLVGPGAASFYKDACRHVQAKPSFESTAHLVAHLLREVESSLHDVLESIAEQKFENKSCETCGQKIKQAIHGDKIMIVSKKLKLPEKVTDIWLGLSGKKGLQKFAHRSGLRSARQIDADFNKLWTGMETVFNVVLDNLETCYIEILARLDELAVKQNPTKEDAKFFFSKIPNNYNTHFHFFNRLTNPDWLPLLEKESVFLEAPEPEQDIENGGMRHIPWPASLYLEKMTPINPGLVTKILQEVKDTDNSNAKGSLLKITSLLPKEKRLLLTNKIKSWLITDYDFFQASLLKPGTELMNKFIEDSEEDSAFEIAKTFLEILPDPKPISDDQEYIPLRDPKTRLEHWHYNEFLKKDFQRLVELNPKRSFDFVCDLLSEYLRLRHEGRKEDEIDFEDFSYISRPSIEDHEQNRDRDDIENTLITAVRNVGLEIISKNPAELQTLIRELEDRKWSVFRRIGLYFLSKSLESAKDLVTQYLTDESLFDNSHYEHEQARLMNKGFRLLTLGQQERILGWIEKAEKITALIEKRKQETSVNKDQEQRFKEEWQRDQLSYMKDDLPQSWKTRYAEFIKKYGEPEHPDFVTYTTSWVGPTSEVKAQELVDMDIEKLLNLFKTWQLKNEPHGFGPTKEGLGRELGAAIKLKPDKFKGIPERFKYLDPTYVRAYIQTFYELAQNGYELDWPKMLELCLWVIEQPRTIPNRQGEIMDHDPDWGWTRKAIASLISRGANNNFIPCELRESVWKILEPLTHDPDPTPEDDSKREEHSDDAYTSAINCTRGEAMNAVVEYALWVYRCTEKQPDGKEKIKTGFDIMPEVKSVLEWHLDPKNDPSVAVRSIYGRFFPWLLLMDRKWTLDHLDMILPPGQFGDQLYMAAWNTLMLYVPVYNDPFEVLKERYSEAVRNLGNVDKSKRRFTDRDERLAEHLMLQYGRGKIELSDDLLKNFWGTADDELRGHALDFVGRSLEDEKNDLNDDILERMKRLWESRIAVAKSAPNKADYKNEMSAFGWWFASGRFDDKWSSDQYFEALDIGKKTQSYYFVFQRLVELAKTLPIEAVKILSKIVLAEQPGGWIVLGNKEEVNTILSIALQAPDNNTHEEAKILINRLVSRGYTEFNDLLNSNNQPNSSV
ncbi:MAG: hypothetical protein WC788_07495 [Candidatus Paceibacterota bacterium]|jgi:hypothetical protein